MFATLILRSSFDLIIGEREMRKIIFSTFFLALFLNGCASITGDSASSVSVQTKSADGREVVGARCELVNQRGKIFVTTPGTIMMQGSNDDLIVTCRKEGHENGMAQVISDTKGSMFGNIILGGGIGAFIDHNNGSAYRYPPFIEVTMGNSVIIGEPQDENLNCGNAMGQNPCPVNSQKKVNISKDEKLLEIKRLKKEGLIDDEAYKKYEDQIIKEQL